jgi:hypothetical protein
MFGLGIVELMALVKDPSRVADTFAKIAPVSLHTMGRKRLYEEIGMLAAILSRNAHNLLTHALLRKVEITPTEASQLDAMEMQLLQMAHKLNEFRKIPTEGFSLDHLRQAYGIAPAAVAAGTGEKARDEGHAAKGNGHAGSA